MTWTEERRAAQRERIQQTKPWLKSTGPKTEEGKKRVRMNALKHGNRSEEVKKIREVLRLNREFRDLAMVLLTDPRYLTLARQTEGTIEKNQ